MPVSITCRGTKLSEQLTALVEKKCQNLKRYFDKVDRIDVVFTAEKHRRKCEIRVHAGHFDQTAIFENGEEGAAFDKALKAMQRQIKESKKRMIERKQRTVSVTRPSNRSGRREIMSSMPEATL
jgi:ribosomal subunit interface protein